MLGPIGSAGRSWQFAGRLGLKCRFAATDSKEQHRLERPSARIKCPSRGRFFANCDRPPANCVHFMSLSRRNAASESEERARGSWLVKTYHHTRIGMAKSHNGLHKAPFIGELAAKGGLRG